IIPPPARRLLFNQIPSHRQKRRAGLALGFEVHPGAGLDPAAGFDERDRFGESVLCKGRIEKNHIERLARLSEIARRGRLQHPGPRRAVQALELLAQRLHHRGHLVDEHHLAGTPRQGLEAERPGACEKIQAARTGEGKLQPVEQSLADPIGRRPQPGRIGKMHAPAAPPPADDAQGVALAGRRLLGLRGGHTPYDIARGARQPVAPGSSAKLWVMTNEADKPGVRGFFQRLRAKINVGPAWLTTDIKELLPGRKIDAEILDELETRLITADVGTEATRQILDDLRRQVARKELGDVDALLAALRKAMVDILAPVERPLVVDPAIKPYVILVVGINGAGKTTTIGKLAHRLLAEGRSVMLAAGDTFRAAAREQLTIWAERNRVPIIAQQSGAEPAAVIFDALNAARARNIDVLIADTAGGPHTQTPPMDELKKVKRVLARLDPSAPHEILLVLDGTIGQNAVAQAEEFNKGLGVTGLVITKLDGTAKGGVVLAIAQRLKIPIRFIGVGEQSEDFGVFNASEFVSALLKSEPRGAAA